jgi:hypothetical protein
VYLKLVNALPAEVSLSIAGLSIPEGSKIERISGKVTDQAATLETTTVGGAVQKLPPYSVSVITL